MIENMWHFTLQVGVNFLDEFSAFCGTGGIFTICNALQCHLTIAALTQSIENELA